MDRIAPARQPFAVERQDADHAAVVLGDVNDVVRIDIEERRTDQLGRPDLQQFSLLIEHLHAIVLAIGDQQPPAPIDPHAMRQVELPRRVARLTPREQMLRVRRELVHAGIAVAIAHEHRAIRRKGDVRRQVERATAVRDLLPRNRTEVLVRHAGIGTVSLDADGLQQLPVSGELHELLVMLVGEPREPLCVKSDRMRELEHSRAPGRDKIAVAIEHDNRMLGDAIKAVHLVLRTDGNRGWFHVHPSRGVRPILPHLVGVLPAANDRFHCSSSLCQPDNLRQRFHLLHMP